MNFAGYLDLQKNHLMDLGKSSNLGADEANTAIQGIQAQLNNVADKYKETSVSSRDILTHQNEITDMVKQETERLASKKTNIDTALEGQQRMTMLNDSYRRKYSFYLKMVLTVLTLTILFVIIKFLSSKVPGIPGSVWDLILIIIFSVGFIYLYYTFTDMRRRDTMNFNKLFFTSPDPKKAASQAKLLTQDNTGKQSLMSFMKGVGGACSGAACCQDDNLTYNEESKVCVLSDNSGFTIMNDTDLVKPTEPDEFSNYGKYQ